MFKEKDGEDLRTELGLTNERADELVNIIQSIMDQEVPDGGYGRTSHVLLKLAGRKDLNDVEKAACIFIFCCKALNKGRKYKGRELRSEGGSAPISPEICITSMPIHGSEEKGLKTKEFIDLERGTSGMMIAPEGVGPEDAIFPIMDILISILRQMPKKDAQEFCRNASLLFARIAETGDIKL